MLSRSEVAAHLRRLTYKPGWTWTLHEDEWEGPYVRFLITVPDNTTGKPITLGINTWLPPMPTTQALERFMAWRLARIENHEMREFFKRDDCVIYDPHATSDA